MDHAERLERLKQNFQRISVTKELYDRLKGEYEEAAEDSDENDLRRLELRLMYAKETILKLTMKNKAILRKLESLGGDSVG